MNTAYHNVIDRFHHTKVLVIGDVILDAYLKGDSTRLCPEAPVPVVNITSKEEALGGAANIAVNLRALGAEVTFLSALGDDADADIAILALQQKQINAESIVKEVGRKTMVKTRIMAQNQILSRFDHGTQKPINEETEQKLISYLQNRFNDFDAVLLGDYYGGILTAQVIQRLQELQKSTPKFIAVDSKNLVNFKDINPTLVKPNYYEAGKLLGITEHSANRAEEMQNLGEELHQKTQAKIIALTLDSDGALVFENGKFVYRSFAHSVPSPNVIGAGDTFIGAFTLALFTGADIPLSTELATAAAAVAVQKEDTAQCSQSELRSFFSIHNKFITHTQELKKLCEIYEAQGKRIIFTNGCFDILHSGHVTYLNRAKELGDILIVALNSDASIKRLKGKDRPINPLEDRMQVLSGLSAIDHIIPFGEENDDTPIELLKIVKPSFYVKGGDYTKETLLEARVVEEQGGEVVFVPMVPDHSTTLIIRRINGEIPYKLAANA
jgi:D-beta-D-heptose 7-phosphate kinase/D-beta-D-heptose 1-phosphate adenosyltransferase